jgi:hypothetical protein
MTDSTRDETTTPPVLRAANLTPLIRGTFGDGFADLLLDRRAYLFGSTVRNLVIGDPSAKDVDVMILGEAWLHRIMALPGATVTDRRGGPAYGYDKLSITGTPRDLDVLVIHHLHPGHEMADLLFASSIAVEHCFVHDGWLHLDGEEFPHGLPQFAAEVASRTARYAKRPRRFMFGSAQGEAFHLQKLLDAQWQILPPG